MRSGNPLKGKERPEDGHGHGMGASLGLGLPLPCRHGSHHRAGDNSSGVPDPSGQTEDTTIRGTAESDIPHWPTVVHQHHARGHGVARTLAALPPSGSALGGNPGRDLRATLQPHLGQQRGDVVLDRLFGNPQGVANFAVRHSVADKVQNLPL